MRCAWQAFLSILPPWMRDKVDNAGSGTLQELRLRMGRPPELVLNTGSQFLNREVYADDLNFCINTASQYSPWAAATISKGYLTAPGGHRIGICGDVVTMDGKVSTVKNISSLCLRVARDISGIGLQAANLSGSVLILGSPGRGKTTLLRDIIRQRSNAGPGAVGVVDERLEIFPIVSGSFCFSPGLRTEVLSGSEKSAGLEILIRTMNPATIAVDEITADTDCMGIVKACCCGVSILATAHAENLSDYMSRPVYAPLIENKVFNHIIVLKPDKSWDVERMNI